ncbi:MAG TPA: hypothetical protein VG936_15285 [Lacunisphaera sp.]|nr:hypothetical protein [Lacunisphaera sp.]
MRTCLPLLARLSLAGALLLGVVPPAHAATAYHFIQEIPVGGDGGWDYLSIDPAAHRLYVSHGTEVVVIDTIADRVVGRILDTPGVHGLAVAADLGRGFTTNGREDRLGIIDLKTLRTVAKVETGANPDAMLYVASTREAYTFNGRGHSATVVDAVAGKVVTTVPLGGKPEFATVDEAAARVYNNLEDQNTVVELDAKTHAILHRWPIAPGEEASGMAIDVAHHRLFLGCSNQVMVMMDATSGRVVSSVPIGRGVDANAFDPGTQLAFASCGDGTVTIAREETPDRLTVVQTLQTQPRARTMTLDPATHRIYLSTASFEPVAPAEAGAGRSRPKMIPGSFRVLVYGID